MLDRSDSQLGLVVVEGKEGGYRGVVREMLENWERRTNMSCSGRCLMSLRMMILGLG